MKTIKFISNDKSSNQFLRTIEFFQVIGNEALEGIIGDLKLRSLNAGEKLFSQGDEPDGIYMVMTGRLFFEKLVSEYGNVRKLRGEFSRKSIIGETAILTGMKRNADVIAYRDSELIYIDTNLLQVLLYKYPDSFLKLIQFVSKKSYKSESSKLHIPLRMISILSLSESVDSKKFMNNLISKLEKYGTAIQVSKSSIQNKTTAEKREFFNRLEVDYQFVFFEAADRDRDWTEFCLSHSDRVFVLDKDSNSGELRDDEDYLYNQHPRLAKDLILLTENNISYTNTHNWTKSRNLERKFLANNNNLEGIDRIARYISGNSIGIALGGGGARGFAHVGVMQGLKDIGVEVDAIGGTSIGSIIGALYALNYSYEKIMNSLENNFIKHNPTGDYRISPISLTEGRIFTASLQNEFQDQLIQNTTIPFYVMACSINKSNLKVFDEGLIWEALRASSSIPGLSPPLLIDNEIYIDGGILNNLPCDIIKDRGANFVIGVDVTGNSSNDNPRIKKYLSSLNPGMSLSLIDSWKKSAEDFLHGESPIIMDLLVESGMLGSKLHKESIKDSINLMLTPNTQNYGLLDWKSLHPLIDIGRDYVEKNKNNIVSLLNPLNKSN